eukprot:TRINITY_DN10094_c0_g3_i6.p1 TRINITY_DN10094_c0_g3~~TRINITY_DN10094_c0_g3_i6.p1  ORF type:complete len:965 (-),score=77.56 TRINITY_DN10094_c0_g3_i6:218-3112(-)
MLASFQGGAPAYFGTGLSDIDTWASARHSARPACVLHPCAGQICVNFTSNDLSIPVCRVACTDFSGTWFHDSNSLEVITLTQYNCSGKNSRVNSAGQEIKEVGATQFDAMMHKLVWTGGVSAVMVPERNLNGYQEDQFDRMEVISGGKRLWKRLKAFSLFRLRLTRSVQGSFPFSGIELVHFGPYPYGHSVITAPAESVVNESARELRVKLQASVVLDAFRLVVEPGTSTTIRWILEGSKDGSSWIPLHMQDSGLRVNRYRAQTKTEKTQWFSTRAVALGTKGLHSCGRFARVLNTADCEAASHMLDKKYDGVHSPTGAPLGCVVDVNENRVFYSERADVGRVDDRMRLVCTTNSTVFEPNSSYVSYESDRCGPRGVSAEANISCEYGSHLIKHANASGPNASPSQPLVTIDGCDYFRYKVYACNTTSTTTSFMVLELIDYGTASDGDFQGWEVTRWLSQQWMDDDAKLLQQNLGINLSDPFLKLNAHRFPSWRKSFRCKEGHVECAECVTADPICFQRWGPEQNSFGKAPAYMASNVLWRYGFLQAKYLPQYSLGGSNSYVMSYDEIEFQCAQYSVVLIEVDVLNAKVAVRSLALHNSSDVAFDQTISHPIDAQNWTSLRFTRSFPEGVNRVQLTFEPNYLNREGHAIVSSLKIFASNSDFVQCEEYKACLQEFSARTDQIELEMYKAKYDMRNNNSLQLVCLESNGISFENEYLDEVCASWKRCLQESGHRQQILSLLQTFRPINQSYSFMQVRNATAGTTASDECIDPPSADAISLDCSCYGDMQEECWSKHGNQTDEDYKQCIHKLACDHDHVCQAWKDVSCMTTTTSTTFTTYIRLSGSSGACRRNSPTDNPTSSYTKVPTFSGDLAACEALCNEEHECKAVEFQVGHTHHCELWTDEPLATSGNASYECLTKPASSNAHKDALIQRLHDRTKRKQHKVELDQSTQGKRCSGPSRRHRR